MKTINKVLKSSEENGKYSLTLKSVGVFAFMQLLESNGVDVSQENILTFFWIAGETAALLFASWGALRKWMNGRWSA